MEIVKLNLKDLAPNSGQIEGLRANPRTWSKSDIERLAASLRETPELFEARPIIVYPLDGKYIILAGNLRYEGAKYNKDKAVPCVVIPEHTPIRKLEEIVIKDNGTFGQWDYKALAEWDVPLPDWGVPEWKDNEKKNHSDLQNPYSTKIQSPIYEPRGTCPAEDELVNIDKVNELLAEIDKAEISEKIKSVLRICAYRHAIIDFENMAEYYCHATKEIQQLMESSALVIIDFDKAVENGFVKMTNDLQTIYDKNKEFLYGTE